MPFNLKLMKRQMKTSHFSHIPRISHLASDISGISITFFSKTIWTQVLDFFSCSSSNKNELKMSFIQSYRLDLFLFLCFHSRPYSVTFIVGICGHGPSENKKQNTEGRHEQLDGSKVHSKGHQPRASRISVWFQKT